MSDPSALIKTAEKARQEAVGLAEQSVTKHLDAAKAYREAGQLLEAAVEYEHASIRAAEDDVDRSIQWMEQAAKLFGQAGNNERAADCACRCARLMESARYGANRRARLYMMAKNYYGNDGAYGASGDMYVAEMNARTELEWREALAPAQKPQERLRHLSRWAGLWLWGITCKHGEGAGRLLCWCLVVILAFAFAYYRAGALGANASTFMDSVVFSGATVTTHSVAGLELTIGQPWPSVVMIEVFLGYAALASFASVIIRKLSRR